jgi:iron complex transport system ATP-binding protein
VPGPDDTERGLILRGVTAGYAGGPILHEVSLTAKPGEVTGLIGPNGSGKTTLVRVAARGLAPQTGIVGVQGIDPYTVSARQAARMVAVVPQEVAPVFTYTVLEMVLMGRSPYQSMWGRSGADDWAQARWAMRAASVQHLSDRPYQELSAGERQRVVLAQALAQDAPVLLLDEPTTHLDIRHVVEMLTVVSRLARSHARTVLVILHDLNLASAYCDRIYVMESGRIVASGVPASVLTATLLREVFGVEAEVSASGPSGRPSVLVGPSVVVTGGGEAGLAHVIGGAGRGASVVRALTELGFDVSIGVLHSGDTDETVAERLNLLRVVVPPFSAIDDRSARDCWEMMQAASLLVVCDAPFGPGNIENLRLAARAVAQGMRTILLDRVPIGERDFTGGEATDLWNRMRSAATVAGSDDQLRHLVEERLAR